MLEGDNLDIEYIINVVNNLWDFVLNYSNGREFFKGENLIFYL